MKDDQLWAKLNEVFQNVFRQPALLVKAETTTWDVPGWDSITHLQLILKVEQEFKLQFELHEIASLETVGDLYAAIERKSAR